MLKFLNGEWVFVRPGLCFEDPEHPETISADNPKVKEIVDAAVKAATSGLEKKNRELLDETKAAKDSAKEATKALAALGGEDGVASLLAVKEQIDADEDLKLFTSGKRDEYNARITGRMKADYEKTVEGKDKRIKTLEDENGRLKGNLARNVVEGEIRKAARELELLPSAVDDAIVRGTQIFSINDQGQPEARDASGGLINGKDGDKPLGISEWLGGMRDTAPHWWQAPSGGGTPNSGGEPAKPGSTIHIGDQRGLNQNLQQIAEGTVTVTE